MVPVAKMSAHYNQQVSAQKNDQISQLNDKAMSYAFNGNVPEEVQSLYAAHIRNQDNVSRYDVMGLKSFEAISELASNKKLNPVIVGVKKPARDVLFALVTDGEPFKRLYFYSPEHESSQLVQEAMAVVSKFLNNYCKGSKNVLRPTEEMHTSVRALVNEAGADFVLPTNIWFVGALYKLPARRYGEVLGINNAGRWFLYHPMIDEITQDTAALGRQFKLPEQLAHEFALALNANQQVVQYPNAVMDNPFRYAEKLAYNMRLPVGTVVKDLIQGEVTIGSYEKPSTNPEKPAETVLFLDIDSSIPSLVITKGNYVNFLNIYIPEGYVFRQEDFATSTAHENEQPVQAPVQPPKPGKKGRKQKPNKATAAPAPAESYDVPDLPSFEDEPVAAAQG